MHVLITPVGHQDPLSANTNEIGSVLTLVKHLQVDRVFLLPTRHPSGESKNDQGEDLDTYDKAVWTRDELLGDGYRLSEEAVAILPLDIDNPTDYAQVLEALERVARLIKEEITDMAEQVTFHVSAASGTPTIKASMMLLVSSGVLSGPGVQATRVYQVANPRYQPADRISTIDVTVIEAARLIDHACDLLQRAILDAASEDLERLAEIAYSPARRALACTLVAYLKALQLHERLAYSAARQAMSDLQGHTQHRQELQRVAPHVDRQLDSLQRLINGNSRERLHDLLLGAERRQRRGEYADALARCWRVTEEALRERLRSVHTIDLDGDVTLSSQQAAMLEPLLKKIGTMKRELPVGMLIWALDLLDDSTISACLDAPVNAVLQRQVNTRLRELIKLGDRHLRDGLFAAFPLDRAWTDRIKPASLEDELAIARRVAAKLSNPKAHRIRSYGDLRKGINVLRNHSVVAHGHLEVTVDDGEVAKALARQIVTVVAGAPHPTHPFGLQVYTGMVTRAREALTSA